MCCSVVVLAIKVIVIDNKRLFIQYRQCVVKLILINYLVVLLRRKSGWEILCIHVKVNLLRNKVLIFP
jgi:hypothetical protein